MILWVFIALLVLFVVLPLVGFAIWWVVTTALVGILFGGLARLIIPGRQNIGVLATIVCGWIGALGGGAIGAIVWGRHHDRFATLLIEVGVSAVAVLAWSGTHRNAVGPTPTHRVIDI
jgi:uncharacterized membrane protein YeaQ/YmgE (transglycosylase-associated protein family)